MADHIFTGGTELYIEHRKNKREGPKVYYVVRKGTVCRSFTDRVELLKWVKWPKSTPTGDELRWWLDEWALKDAPPPPEAETKLVT